MRMASAMATVRIAGIEFVALIHSVVPMGSAASALDCARARSQLAPPPVNLGANAKST